jgi:outer membrane murein-binding lipoprotein Lpp
MSDEIREKINTILTQVDELHAKQAALEAEKLRHQEIIQASEAEIQRCDAELWEVRTIVLDRRNEMEEAHRKLFGEEAAPAAGAEAGDDEQGKESAAKKLWNQEARRHKLTVT